MSWLIHTACVRLLESQGRIQRDGGAVKPVCQFPPPPGRWGHLWASQWVEALWRQPALHWPVIPTPRQPARLHISKHNYIPINIQWASLLGCAVGHSLVVIPLFSRCRSRSAWGLKERLRSLYGLFVWMREVFVGCPKIPEPSLWCAFETQTNPTSKKKTSSVCLDEHKHGPRRLRAAAHGGDCIGCRVWQS